MAGQDRPRIARPANIFGLVELGLLALVFPLALFPTAGRSVALLAVPGLWLVHGFINRRRARGAASPSAIGGHFIPRTPLDLPILLLAAMVLVSLYATYDIATSLPKVAGVVFGIGLYYALVRACRTPRAWLLGLAGLLAAGLGIAALGLVGSKWAHKFPFLSPILALLPARFTGLPGAEQGFHPNEIAGALLWAVPAFVVLLAYVALGFRALARRLGRVWALALFTLLLAGTLFTSGVLVLTQSRGGLLGLGVGVIAVLLVAGRRSRLFLLCLVLAMAGLALFGLAYGGPDRWAGLVPSPGDGLGSALSLDTLEGRLELWSRAIYGIQDFAFTGMGMNTFRRVVHVLYPLFLIGPDTDIGHAHNEFLQAALDLGVPGLIAFASLYAGAIAMLVQAARRAPKGSAAWMPAACLGLGGGLLAHAVYGLTDAVALGAKPGVIWWWVLGLVASRYSICLKPSEPAGVPRARSDGTDSS